MITRLEATRYRCLERLDADLGEFALVVGANGAGKTTFLDLPVLLGDLLTQKDAAAAFSSRLRGLPPRCGALSELVFCGRGDDFILAVEAALPDTVVRELLPSRSGPVQNQDEWWPRFIRYELRLQVFNQRSLYVDGEYLFLFSRASVPDRDQFRLLGEHARKKDWRFVIDRAPGQDAQFRSELGKTAKPRSVRFEPEKLAFARMSLEGRNEFPAAAWLYSLLSENSLGYRPNSSVLQTASPPGQADVPVADAANLPWLAMGLRNRNPKRFQAWVDHVRTALPQIVEIEVHERQDDHHAYFRLVYQGGHSVTSSGLSEGTLRVLALTLLPYVEKRQAVLVVEEPEIGIHPHGIESVIQSLSSVYNSQVLVTTHSPVVLAQCRLDQILCARLEESGAASVVPGRKHPRLTAWKGRIDLGALFAAGVLG